MKRRYTATGVQPKPGHLNVFVTMELGTAVRFTTIKVPWSLLEVEYRAVVEAMESIAAQRLEQEAGVLYLPLEKWE